MLKRMWNKLTNKGSNSSQREETNQSNNSNLLSEQAKVEQEVVEENLPSTMSFTTKTTNVEVVNWLCQTDQSCSQEQIYRCF